MKPPLLEVRDLAAWYGNLKVLRGVDLAVAEGGITALIGANGAGKTTVLRALTGTIRAEGHATFDGAPLLGRATPEIARLGIATVPEGRGTFVRMSVEDNLRIGALGRRCGRALMRAEIDRICGYFPRLGERRRQAAGTLSGGEQQMLAIGRALIARPRLLILDEPSFGLAQTMIEELLAILRQIRCDERISILLVEESARLVLDLADEVAIIESGRTVGAGPVDMLRAQQDLQKAYLTA